MKKIFIILIIFIVLGVVIFKGFKDIEKENFPYLSNYKQFQKIFNDNFDKFEQLAEEFSEYEDIINFQFNSNFGHEQVYNWFGYGEASDIIIYFYEEYKLTNVTYVPGHFSIFQYPPIPSSDLNIGVRYNYEKRQWEYFYNHDYNMCWHKHKYIYRLYDLIYNTRYILHKS